MTASTATTGASRAAHVAHVGSGILAASSRWAMVTMAVWKRSISARNSGSRAAWWNSSRNPSGSSAAAPTSASMLAAVKSLVPTVLASRVQARSRTARYRSVLESKWRYRIARLTPAWLAGWLAGIASHFDEDLLTPESTTSHSNYEIYNCE